MIRAHGSSFQPLRLDSLIVSSKIIDSTANYCNSLSAEKRLASSTGSQVFETWCNALQFLMAEKTQVCKKVMAGHNFGSFLLRNVIKSGGIFFFSFLSFNLHMRHSKMDIRTQIMTQEHQAGRAEQALQCKREGEKIAAASTIQGQLCGRETKGCRLWKLVAPSITSVCFYEVGLQGRILYIVTIF